MCFLHQEKGLPQLLKEDGATIRNFPLGLGEPANSLRYDQEQTNQIRDEDKIYYVYLFIILEIRCMTFVHWGRGAVRDPLGDELIQNILYKPIILMHE